MPCEKFASEIFCHNPSRPYAAMQKKFTYLCGLVSNRRRINRFRVDSLDRPEPAWATRSEPE